ncbi:hypothetical protein AVEN_172805-1 [Araneus ventricosus]|uniref:Reverse transcriptase domain-containing protein n=1 Tax=Araneus ventricosus TaxID=182803 RepID=A0A4Y2BJH8_ARAVE|nr:hypothetical protein AVEN_172805-1 [Araneus ventricosus]
MQEGQTTKEQKQVCPQGSCRGPALWNLVTNDLLNQDWPAHTSIQASADDFILVIKARTKEDLRRSTQESIGKFTTWADNNNLENCKKVIIHSKRFPVDHYRGLQNNTDGCTPGDSGDPTFAPPITAGCQNNRFRNKIQHIPYLSPEVLEQRVTGWTAHSSKHLLPHQISFDDGGSNNVGTRLYTDGSKPPNGAGTAFCMMQENTTTHQ